MGRDGDYEATFGAPYYGVHRVALLQALADAARAGDGLHLGRRCVGVDERRAAGAELRVRGRRERRRGRRRRRRRRALRDPPARRGRPVRGRFSGTVGYRGLVPVEAHAVAARSDAAAVLGRPAGATSCTTRSTAARPSTSSPSSASREWTNAAWMEPCAVSDAVDAFAGWHPAVTEMVGATRRRRAAGRCTTSRRSSAGTPTASSCMGDAAHAHGAPPGPGRQPDDRGRDRSSPTASPAARRPRARAARATPSAGASARPRVQRWSRRAADLMHLPDGPEIAPRDALFGGALLRAGLDPFLRRAGVLGHEGARVDEEVGDGVTHLERGEAGSPGSTGSAALRPALPPATRRRQGPWPTARSESRRPWRAAPPASSATRPRAGPVAAAPPGRRRAESRERSPRPG